MLLLPKLLCFVKLAVSKSSYVLFEASCCGLSHFVSLEDLILMSEKDSVFSWSTMGKKNTRSTFLECYTEKITAVL